MTSYLAEAGVSAPPRNAEWRLVLPWGVTERAFFAAANSAVRHLAPFAPETAPLNRLGS